MQKKRKSTTSLGGKKHTHMTQKGLRAYLLFMIFFFLIESQQWSLVVFFFLIDSVTITVREKRVMCTQ